MISGHSGHCRLCKERVRQLLTALYGDCRIHHSFPWPATLQGYENTSLAETLRNIYAGLKRLRGYGDFIKSANVPPCDFYISTPPFILEFDESQHFTRARLVALSFYPPEFKGGFSLHRWKELCSSIDAKDDEPPDRDERRAWYDTLRDLVPPLHGFNPTVRLYADELRWCSLDGDSKKDRETFHSLVGQRLGQAP